VISNGLCFVGNDPTRPGFQYELVGTDAKGTIVERRSVCVAFEQPGVTPPPPPLPQVPTFAEAWNAAQLPPPMIVTDPRRAASPDSRRASPRQVLRKNP